ncbi:MAG TPA: ABC transporter permease, partial [Niastella sp.]|nr:ABC transporter permease [Niastella sp.]
MFRNYFKIAFRNLLRNKAFSAINISGLAIGMASTILILLWVQNELSYDRFHAKKDRIYEAWNVTKMNGEIASWNTTPKVLAKTVQQDFPEIEHAVRESGIGSALFSVREKHLTATGDIADSNFLQVFSFPLLQGSVSTALADMHAIVLTEKLAKKLFGKEQAMGQTVKLNNEDAFTVTGILKDLPNNTRFNF